MAADIDLLVLGDANPDLILLGGDVVPAFGQAEHLVDDARLTMGGSGAILACGAAKLGLRVAICALVGDDLFGRYVREGLESAGVETSGIAVDQEAATGVTVVLSGPDDRAIITMPGTIAGLRAELIDPSLLERARHVHVSSYYLQTALAPSLPNVFDAIHEHGATTSIDPNWDPSGLWDAGLLELASRDRRLPAERDGGNATGSYLRPGGRRAVTVDTLPRGRGEERGPRRDRRPVRARCIT